MITDSFDLNSKPVIEPDMVYQVHEPVETVCIVSFSGQVRDHFFKRFSHKEIGAVHIANGSIPVYSFEYKGKEMYFYLSPLGSAISSTVMDEARALFGIHKFVVFGSCGVLNSEIPQSNLIVPTASYRDEGFSYHYVKPADYIEIRNADKVSSILDEIQIPYVKGKNWCTDALYRETQNNLAKRQAEGCNSVEMESAGMQAICDYRNMDYYPFFFGADLLDAPEWNQRNLGNENEKEAQLNTFDIACEVALRV